MSSIFTQNSLFEDSLDTQNTNMVVSSQNPLTLKSFKYFKYAQKKKQSQVDQISSIDGSLANIETSNEYVPQSLFSDPFIFGGEEAC